MLWSMMALNVTNECLGCILWENCNGIICFFFRKENFINIVAKIQTKTLLFCSNHKLEQIHNKLKEKNIIISNLDLVLHTKTTSNVHGITVKSSTLLIDCHRLSQKKKKKTEYHQLRKLNTKQKKFKCNKKISSKDGCCNPKF